MPASIQKAWVCPEVYKTRDIAVFKKYCKDIRDALDLAMVRTSDTGQVDLDTIVAPSWTASEVGMGYLIYRFDDALQATNPIFMRIDFNIVFWSFSTSNSTAMQAQGAIQTKFTFGTGTDGAGTITSPSMSVYSPFTDNDDTTTAEAASRSADRNGINYLSYNDEQGFLFFVYGSGANYRIGTSNNLSNHNLAMFCVQRTLDDRGQPDGRGFVVIGRDDLWQAEASNFATPKISTYLYSTNSWVALNATSYLTQSTGENLSAYFMLGDKFVVNAMKYWDPDYGVRTLPNVLFMSYDVDYPGAHYTIETSPGWPRRFRSLGLVSMWRPTSRNWGDYSCIVLWE